MFVKSFHHLFVDLDMEQEHLFGALNITIHRLQGLTGLAGKFFDQAELRSMLGIWGLWTCGRVLATRARKNADFQAIKNLRQNFDEE